MLMRVRLPRWVLGTVRMPMMFIMYVRMCVRHQLMGMLVFMTLGHVQPDTYCHERSCREEPEAHRFLQHDNRGNCSEERRCREIRSGSRRTQMAQRDDKKCQA